MAIEFYVPDTNISPPGGWEYTFPETSWTAKHFDFNAFRKQVEQHALGNNLNLSPEWVEELLDKLCKQNGVKWSKICERTGGRITVNPLNFGTLMSFLNVMKKWAVDTLNGEEGLVPQEVAEERAAICATCPYNMALATGCGSCVLAVSRGIEAVIGGKKTSNDNILEGRACGICGCALKAAIWVPISAQVAGMSDTVKDRFKEVSSYCWKAKDL